MICSGEIVDLKILQSDWLRAFWPRSPEKKISQYDLCRNTANNINFYSRTNPVKINNQIFGLILAYFEENTQEIPKKYPDR